MKGDIYTTKRKLNDTLPIRLENREYKLERAQIYVTEHTVYIGNISRQEYPIGIAGSVVLHNVDLADLWFKAIQAGSIFYVIGTTK